MRAAVVREFGRAPEVGEMPEPVASSPDEEVVRLVAAAVSPRVRSQADGSHYSSRGVLPIVPGIDGVGRAADGALTYFVLPDTDRGSLADRILIDRRRSVVLPDGVDPVTVAAAMNPAMSSWIALTERIELPPAARVLVLGATGNAGRMAVQIAKRLGAAQVAAAGRNPARLEALRALGADTLVDLAGEPGSVAEALAAAGREADVVLDYLWGEPTAAALRAIVPARSDEAQQLTWIQIGSVAGRESPIPSAALRACRLRIVGSGQGSVAPDAILTALPGLAAEVTSGRYAIAARPVPLADTATAWAAVPTTDERIVIIP